MGTEINTAQSNNISQNRHTPFLFIDDRLKLCSLCACMQSQIDIKISVQQQQKMNAALYEVKKNGKNRLKSFLSRYRSI